MKEDPIISLRGVCKTYRMGETVVRALWDIDLDVMRGEFVAVMGPSGSGKSTLMNIIGLLDRPDRGIYRLREVEVGSLDDDQRSRLRNREIGFVFQNFNLLPRADALRNVMLPLMYRPGTRGKRAEPALNRLKVLGLGDRVHHLPSQLSGGESQRVAIARALVGNPDIILADEPTGNLDTNTGWEIIKILGDQARQGQTVIMVTHDVRLVREADRIVRMTDGALVEGAATP